jgi:hypothetical protein
MDRYPPRLFLGLVLIAGFASAASLPAQQFTGRGTQVYRCEMTKGVPSWKLLGPDAHLYDAAGKLVARHFYGPTWQANDGSEIKGSVLLTNAAPGAPRNAPWLVLRVVFERGPGIFAHVTTVTRTDTDGGGSPLQACTMASQGTTVKMPYSARYTFFSEARTKARAE